MKRAASVGSASLVLAALCLQALVGLQSARADALVNYGACPYDRNFGADPWIGNSIIGMNVTELGSAEGTTVLQYPIGTQQGYFQTYWLRYDNVSNHATTSYYGDWPWPWEVPSAGQVTTLVPMQYTVNTPDEMKAYGKVKAGLLDIEITASSESTKPWVRILYTIQNTNPFPVTNVRFSQFADMDVGEPTFGGATPENMDDSTRFDAENNTVFMIDHVDGTPDSAPELETDPELWLLGIMSPVASDHHDVYGGPNTDYPGYYANPAYYHCEDDTLNDADYFFGDGGMTMQWILETLAPNASVTIPVYFIALQTEEELDVISEETALDFGWPVIRLHGADPQLIERCSPYVELGASATDIADGDLTANIVIDAGAVNTAIAGDYTVTYNVSDSAGNAALTVTRTVTVVDTTPPLITLNGPAVRTLEANIDTYTEQGATATDICDASVPVTTGGDTVDTTVPGVYLVTYDATDASGNAAGQKTRIVRVVGQNDLKMQALAQLLIMQQTADKKDARKIADAIKNIGDSLDARLWETSGTLTACGGKKVFDKERKAVDQLKHLPDDHGVTAILVHVDESLAILAINEARAALPTGDPKADEHIVRKLIDAHKEMLKADEELARSAEELANGGKDSRKKAIEHSAKAIGHYKHAWQKAMEALKKKCRESGDKDKDDKDKGDKDKGNKDS